MAVVVSPLRSLMQTQVASLKEKGVAAAQHAVLQRSEMSESTVTAFGMGVDIPDVELVIHWGVSTTVLDYWQEVGRAGRDGQQSLALLFATPVTISDKRMTKDCVRELHKQVSKEAACFRLCILKVLYLECMDKTEIKRVEHKDECTSDCSPGQSCACALCACCSNCQSKCCTVNAIILPELQHHPAISSPNGMTPDLVIQ
ncbi:uncharacterized protein [Haliotis asinina]|uniref:uncharacterized protein n=1 Tax=Haliotis asinina TaxID=109174 RepID=UPI003531D716